MRPLRTIVAGILLAVIFTGTALGWNEIVLDAVSTNSGDTSVFVHSHSVSGQDRLLVVGVTIDGNQTSDSVFYAGQPLTQVAARTHDSGTVRVEVWQLINPSPGTADIEVRITDTVAAKAVVGAISYTGVDQTIAIDHLTASEGAAAAAMNSVSSEVGDLVQDVFASTAGGASVIGLGQDSLWSDEMGGTGTTDHWGSASTKAGQAMVNMQWTLQEAAKHWVSVGFNINAHASTGGEVYYVSPTGNDSDNGHTVETAWATINRGDQDGLIQPGDTINILPGTYSLDESLALESDGDSANPILYRSYGSGQVLLEGNEDNFVILNLSGKYTRIEGLEIANGGADGVRIRGDSSVIFGCYIHDVDGIGVKLEGADVQVLFSIISKTGSNGIRGEGSSVNSATYNNTIYDCAAIGIEMKAASQRAFNNIVAFNEDGIRGAAGNIVGFNCVFGNSGYDYDGVVDSAGGHSANPQFVDTAAGDFRLQSGSPCIDRGLDLGYPFNGDAPDIGALEREEGNALPILVLIGEQSVNENASLTFGIMASDVESTPGLTTSGLPVGASFVDNTDGTGLFNWTPTYSQSGSYYVTFYATDDSSAVDSEVVTIIVNDVNRAPVLATIGSKTVEEGQNLNFDVSASDPDGTTPTLSAEDLPTNATFDDNGDGTGTFDFDPDYTQENTYSVRFITSDGDLADTELVAITVTPAPITYIDVLPPDNIVIELTSVQYTAFGYDAGSVLVRDLTDSVVWSTTDPAGSITAGGLYSAGNSLSPPDYFVKAIYGGSQADSGRVTVISVGALDYVQVERFDGTLFGDTTLTTDNDTTTFYCRGYGSGGDLLGDVAVNWTVIGANPVGAVSPSGGVSTTLELFTPGTGRIVATKGPTMVDTSGVITVSPGALAQVVVSPDSVRVGIGDTTQFSVTGYDADANETDYGNLTWKLVGRNGTIDNTGLFIASGPGKAVVAVTSSVGGLADSSAMLAVEELLLTTIPVGNVTVRPSQLSPSLLTFRLDNYFDELRTINSVTIRADFDGPGSSVERLTNAEAILLYLDVDHDSLLSAVDSLLDEQALTSIATVMDVGSFIIEPGTGHTFLVALTTSATPCDNDTLDLYLQPAIDVEVEEGTVVAGPATANSLGYILTDGMTSAQLTLTSTGQTTVVPGDSLYVVMTLDIPRNGYDNDLLQILRIVNSGNATASDFDSLCLFRDDGNGSWDGPSIETALGQLVYTGAQWSISGLDVALDQLQNRFHVAVDLAEFPSANSTLSFGVPLAGLDVASGNDGPIDVALSPIDTITILSDEKVVVSGLQQESRQLIPGEQSEPVLTLQLNNTYSVVVGLDSLELELQLDDSDGALQAQLNSQIDSLLLYLDRDNDIATLTASDSLVAVASATGGTATFNTTGLTLAASGGQVRLSVTVAMNSQNSKNGNSVNIALAGLSDLHFGVVTQTEGTFPITNVSDHTIEAFPAALVNVTDLGDFDLNATGTDRPVFLFSLPGNGYDADVLDRLQLTNTGTVDDQEAIAAMKLWADQTGDGFTNDDAVVGVFSYDKGSWELTKAAFPIAATGQKFIVTVDVSSNQFETGTFALEIPIGGCLYESDLSGPDDQSATAPDEYRVYPADRMTVISVPQTTSSISPGSRETVLMVFALYNGYGGEDQRLEGISFVNTTHSRSGSAFADHELGQVSLLYDANNDRVLDDDSLIATGHFVNGQLHLSGIGVGLPSDSLSYFFVTANLPFDLIDLDSLDIRVTGPADLIFGQSVVINGDLPLQSGGHRVIDGSVAEQYTVVDQMSATLSPGDTNVVLFAFRPAKNGDLPDTLQTINIVNMGDADGSDISSLEFWLDVDADMMLSPADQRVATGAYVPGTGWSGTSLDVEIQDNSPMLFVVADIYGGATPGRTFQAQIPIGGVTYSSSNDGPIDAPLTSNDVFSISASPLRIANVPLDDSYSVGQALQLRFSVTNRLDTTLAGVTGRVVSYDDSSTVVADSSVAGPVTLVAGATTEFVFYYTTDQAGSISFMTQALASAGADSSAMLQTNTSQIQLPAQDVLVEFYNSIPAAVTKGQSNIFPFSMRLKHSGAGPTCAPVRLDSLRISVSDGQGVPLAANAVFSRVALDAGYQSLSVIEAIPPQNSIMMNFSSPVIVAVGDEVWFSLLVDIDSLATATGFILSIDDPSSIMIVDGNSGQPVNLDNGVVFPLATASCRVDNPSQLMTVSSQSLVGSTVNYGQPDVDLVRLRLRHPGTPGSSQIQLTDLTLQLLDEAGTPIIASEIVDYIRLIKHNTVISELAGLSMDSTSLTMQLSSPVTLNPGELDSIRITATIKESASRPGFSVRITDSLAFIVRDLSSGSLLQAATDTLALAASSVFPILSSYTEMMLAAQAVTVCPVSLLPAATVGGVDSLELIELFFEYPVSASHSSLLIDQILITIADSMGAPLDPSHLFDRLGYIDYAGLWHYQQFVLTESGATRFVLDSTGLRIDPGDETSITLIGDISAGSNIDHFVLGIGSGNSFGLADATDTSSSPGVEVPITCTATIPFFTTVTNVYHPAGRPHLVEDMGQVQIAHRGQQGVTIFRSELTYDNAEWQGDINLGELRGRLLKRTGSGLVAVGEDDLFVSINLYANGVLVAGDSVLSDDTLVLAFNNEYSISQGDVVELVLQGDIRAAAALGNYVVSFEDSTYLEITDANLATTIIVTQPVTGYPLLGTELSIVPTGLAGSFFNYPNPFNPANGSTTFAYSLSQEARIDIELFTITGKAVKTIVAGSLRSEGSHQDDRWSGRNGLGLDVVPGTYFCRVTANYTDGTTETFLRKVAVLR